VFQGETYLVVAVEMWLALAGVESVSPLLVQVPTSHTTRELEEETGKEEC
jgi:hypothetical protein